MAQGRVKERKQKRHQVDLQTSHAKRRLHLRNQTSGDSTRTQSLEFALKHPLIARLDAVVKAKGLEVVAEGIKVHEHGSCPLQ
jgi:hypothetical protein